MTPAELLEAATGIVCDWYPPPAPVDWDDALDRVESYLNVDLPESMLDPLILNIQRSVRAARREIAS